MGKSGFFFGVFVLFVSLGLGFVSAQLTVPRDLPQNPILTIQGQPSDFSTGAAVQFVNDITNDGYNEIIGGAPDLTSTFIGNAYLYDGKTGTILNQFIGTTAGGQFGKNIVNLGDVNGNGFDDIAISEENWNGPALLGTIFVYDTGGQLDYQIQGQVIGENLGGCLGNIGDITGDGINDLGACSNAGNPRRFYVYNGANGNLISQVNLPSPNQVQPPTSIDRLGDINADGISDFLVSVPANTNIVGQVILYSGSNFNIINTVAGTQLGDGFGFRVANIGDYNGDNFVDFAVTKSDNGPSIPYVRVYSGSQINNFAQLAQFNGLVGQTFGSSVVGADVNYDGFSDLVIGSGGAKKVDIYLGGTGTLLYSWTGSNFGAFGTAVATRDYNGDGFNEMAAGDPGQTGPLLQGTIRVHTLGGAWSYGSGTLATWTPAANPAANPASGTITVTGANPSSPGFVLCSAASANIPVSTGNTLYVDPNSLLVAPIPITFSASGSWTSPLLGLQNAAAAGTEVFCQVIAYSGGSIQNAQFSNGEQLTLVA